MTDHFLSIQLGEEEFLLLPHKALYRPLKNQLILSDVHLGKATHFRKAGIPFPQLSQLKDIDLITYLIKMFEPTSVLFLGDLFHSNYNKEWFYFTALLKENNTINFILVEGNHDVLYDEHYNLDNLIKQEFIKEENIIFSHQPLEDPMKINICGHIHPGITISGRAKQIIKLPCFYKTGNHFILPAFGSLTGMYLIDKIKTNDYYVVYNNLVRKI